LMDIEAYAGRSIPTIAITNDLLADPLPPVRMKRPKPPHKTTKNPNKGSGRPQQGTKRHNTTRNRSQRQPG